jgi:hypothetical protein
MVHLIILSIALVSIPRFAETAPLQANDTAAVIDSVQKAVVRALNYSQGDRQSLIDAQDDFTADGWREFMKRMEGFLDSKGAPLGSSSFMPSGNAVITDQQNGVIHLMVPGVLKQSQNQSATTYRLMVDVRIAGNPVKITHLEPIVKLPPAQIPPRIAK